MQYRRQLFLTVQIGLLAAARCAVGGQAVMEGVLMRSPRALAIAVRKPSGEIVIKEQDWHSVTERFRFMRWPFLRGMVMLFETMANGYQALTWSAGQAAAGRLEAEGEKDAAAAVSEQSKLVGWALAGTMVFAMGIGFCLFVVAPHLVTAYVNPLMGISGDISSASFNLVDGAIKMSIFVAYVLLISRMPDIRRVFQYHGAEHKSIHVFEHGEALDVENARKFPRLHPRCGTTFLLFVILVSIATFTAIFPWLPHFAGLPKLVRNLVFIAIKLPLMLPVAGISYEIIRLAGKAAENARFRTLYQPAMFLQRITTAEPDDSQMEVALAALKAALAREAVLNGGVPVLAEHPVAA